MTSFFCDEAAEDNEYNVIRDEPRFSQDKAFIEEMWSEYKQYADRHFLLESRKNFKQRIWEMYLTCSLIAKGFSITSDDKGPDIRISYARGIISDNKQKRCLRRATPTLLRLRL